MRRRRDRLAEERAGRAILRQPSEQIRRALRGDQYHLFHLMLLALLVRGEDIRGEVGRVVDLMRADVAGQRRQGWRCLDIAYPDLAARISEYDPEAPAEVCRAVVDRIA